MVKSHVMLSSALLLLLASTSQAATRIAVLELGPQGGGTVRRTTAQSPETTVDGVASFWSALHNTGVRRKLQNAGMTVVPDLFKKPDGGIVVGLSGPGMDLDNMPFVSSLVVDESTIAVGNMEVDGNKFHAIMSNVPEWSEVSPLDWIDLSKKQLATSSVALVGFKTVVDVNNAQVVDQKVAALVEHLDEVAKSSGKNMVLHLVVEEDSAYARRRLLARRRRLDQQQNDDNIDGNNANQNQYDGYYGYGYYNSHGEWVTTYKTIFQIQYFNIVLWTALCLVAVLFFTIYLMVYMPLEPDTLLFGESAKHVGDE